MNVLLLNEAVSAVHFVAEVWRLMTPTTIKNCFLKCGFLVGHVINDDRAVKLNEGTG
jgi:hypothetical protein